MSNTLNDSATKLLELVQSRHKGMHFISAHGAPEGEAFVQIMIPVDEINRIAEGMATLASLIVLNPTYVTQTREGTNG